MKVTRHSPDLWERFDQLGEICDVTLSGGAGGWHVLVRRADGGPAIAADAPDLLEVVVEAVNRAEILGWGPASAGPKSKRK